MLLSLTYMYCVELNLVGENTGECVVNCQNFPCCYFVLYDECLSFWVVTANLLPVNSSEK